MAKKTVKKKSPTKSKIEIDSENSYSSSSRKPRGGYLYGLGFLGSVIYFISTTTGFWMGVLGVLKSIVWPAFMVFELFKFLRA